jgi:peptidoglycan/LPS O-acetylase OafA/YrhL
MPSSASRSRATTRRSPRPAPRTAGAGRAPGARPSLVPFAVAFGVLVAAEDLYLAWLLRTPELGWDWFMVVPLLLAVLAAGASAAVFLGRARGWLLLAAAAILPLVGLLVLVVLFALLGAGRASWSAVLLLVGPVGCLVLALRRPVREWTRPVRGSRSPG